MLQYFWQDCGIMLKIPDLTRRCIHLWWSVFSWDLGSTAFLAFHRQDCDITLSSAKARRQICFINFYLLIFFFLTLYGNSIKGKKLKEDAAPWLLQVFDPSDGSNTCLSPTTHNGSSHWLVCPVVMYVAVGGTTAFTSKARNSTHPEVWHTCIGQVKQWCVNTYCMLLER